MAVYVDIKPSVSVRTALETAAAEHRDGNKAAARKLLEKMGATGEPAAVFAFASALASGYGGDADREAALHLLQTVEGASLAARRMLAVGIAAGWAAAPDRRRAFQRRLDHCSGGDVVAATEVGLILAARDPLLAAPFLERAAASGVSYALAGRLRAAHQAGRRIETAERDLASLKANRNAASVELSSLLFSPSALLFESGTELDLDSALQALFTPSPLKDRDVVSDDPYAFASTGVVPDILCDYALARFMPLAAASKVYDRRAGKLIDHPVRRSHSAFIDPVQYDLVLMEIERLALAAAERDVARAEPLTTLFYRPGDRYRAHVDYFEDDGGEAEEELARAGQRERTVLFVLSDRFTGGETQFVESGASWKGTRGDVFVFDNLDKDGNPNPRSRHTGNEVLSGMKALGSIWVRERPIR